MKNFIIGAGIVAAAAVAGGVAWVISKRSTPAHAGGATGSTPVRPAPVATAPAPGAGQHGNGTAQDAQAWLGVAGTGVGVLGQLWTLGSQVLGSGDDTPTFDSAGGWQDWGSVQW